MFGPCDWTIDTTCCSNWADLSPELQLAATNYATTVLWAATGRQFGLCEQTIRPCGRHCSRSNVAGWWWSEGVFIPYIFNGEWRNCWCGCGTGPGCCTCEPHCQLYLPGPVASVSSVVVDGFLVDPSTYRVDDAKWLVRTEPGECWTRCQDYNLDAGLGVFNDNTLQVTYLRGEPVPAALQVAAGVLACEFAKACQNQPCRLPGRLSTVARQGVQLTFQNIDQLISAGFTGLPEVDQLIQSYNPYHLPRPMRLWSPDLPKHRQVTSP